MSMNAGELLFETPLPDALQAGTRLRAGTVVECIGGGATGHVYRVLDDRGNPIAVREYYPPSLSMRIDDRVEPLPQREAGFEAARKRFDEDGEELAAFDHPGLLKVHQVWSERGTSYLSMPWCTGRTLEEVVRSSPDRVSEAQLSSWLRAMADALVPVHRERGLHGHLSPSQVMLLDSGRLLLMEFSRTRHFLASDPREIERDPYAALECGGDGRHGPVGPWTDIYALASIAHFVLRGRAPQAPVHRAAYDVQEPLLERIGGYPAALLHGLDCGLALRPRERPRDLPRFMSRMGLHERRSRPRSSGESLLINLELPHAVVEPADIAIDAAAEPALAEADTWSPTIPAEVLAAEAMEVAEPQTIEMPAVEAVAEPAAAIAPAASADEAPWPTSAAAASEAHAAPSRYEPEPEDVRPRRVRRSRAGAWFMRFGAMAALAAIGYFVIDQRDEAALSMSLLPAAAPAQTPAAPEAQTTARADPPAAAAPAASSPIPEPLEPTAAGTATVQPAEPDEQRSPQAPPLSDPVAESKADASVPMPTPTPPTPAAKPAPEPPRGPQAIAKPAAAPPATAVATPQLPTESTATPPSSPCPGLLARQYIGRPLDATEREVLKSQCL